MLFWFGWALVDFLLKFLSESFKMGDQTPLLERKESFFLCRTTSRSGTSSMVDSNIVLKNEYFKIKCEKYVLGLTCRGSKRNAKRFSPKKKLCKVLPQFYMKVYESN